ncbi:MAG: hypothetical protein Q7K03_05625 [Dehalococcoidia bacterium]|nr:hypothetical protein [Dehalococcoidia bacterium]
MKSERRKPKKRGRGARVPWRVAGALVVAMIMVLALVLLGRGGEQDSARVSPSGSQRVGPLEVLATRIDLGQVPLAQWASPTFRLRNVSAEPVTITIPEQGVEVVEGC